MVVGGGASHAAQFLKVDAKQQVMFREILFQAHVDLYFGESQGVARVFALGGGNACQRSFQADARAEADPFQT